MYIAGFISQWIWGIFLYMDGIIYDVVRWVYQIFNALAKLNLFDDGSYQQIVQRIYIILGVVMLFVLAYSLLKAVINPDDFAKGEASFPNLIKNVVISLVIIAVLPTVFTFAFNVQNAILNQETIPKLILNDTGQTDPNGNAIDAEYIRENGGGTIAYWTFRAFFNPKECASGQGHTVDDGVAMSMAGLDVCADSIEANKSLWENVGDFFLGWAGYGSENPTLKSINNEVYAGKSFSSYAGFSDAVDDGKISYLFPISTIVGIVVLLILLTYCISLALRVIKLAFYQIIAPIPVIMRVLPGDKKKVFDNWVKQIIGTFIDVFIRIGILYLGVYLIQMIVNKFAIGTEATSLDLLGPIQKLFAVAFLIVGVLMFIRSAPGLLKDLFGFDLGGGLNPFKIFQDATQAVAPVAGLVGGGISTAVQNLNSGRLNGKGFWRTLGSTVAGFGSGAARGAYNARNAKNFADIRKATSDSIKSAANRRKARETYRSTHGDTFTGSLIGHVSDAISGVREWAGLDAGLDAMQAEKDFYGQLTNIDDNTDKIAAELLERDAISGSAALMRASGGPNMALGAMKSRLESASHVDVSTMIGHTVQDFNGHISTIRTENDYANYLNDMKQQLNKAERGLKGYLKTQGYQGTAGIASINGILGPGNELGTGELQRMSKLYADRQNIEEIVRENETMIRTLNEHVPAGTARISEINDGSVTYTDATGATQTITGAWNLTDQLINNAKSRVINLNTEMDRLKREQDRRHPQQGNNGGH